MPAGPQQSFISTAGRQAILCPCQICAGQKTRLSVRQGSFFCFVVRGGIVDAEEKMFVAGGKKGFVIEKKLSACLWAKMRWAGERIEIRAPAPKGISGSDEGRSFAGDKPELREPCSGSSGSKQPSSESGSGLSVAFPCPWLCRRQAPACRAYPGRRRRDRRK